MKNKNIIIVVFVLIVILTGVLLYSIFAPNTTPKNPNTISNSPTGRPTTPINNTDQNPVNNNSNGNTTYEQPKSDLFQISKDPVSGFVIPTNSSSTMVRFTDRMTGHTLQTDLEKIDLSIVTITSIPKIYEAIWSNLGSYVALRYLNGSSDVIKTFWGRVANSSSTQGVANRELSGSYLPNDTTQFVTSPDGKELFFLTATNDGSAGFSAKNDLTSRKQIFTSAAKEWLVTWPKQDTIILNTKPSYTVPGYIFSLNTNTGTFKKVVGGIYGLTSIFDRNLNKIFYSSSPKNTLRTGVYDIKTQKSINLSVITLPEKCVWSSSYDDYIYCAVPKYLPEADYPDAWYQGQIQFSDRIWKIDVTTGETSLIKDLGIDVLAGIDATNLQIDKDENYLTFINKNDMQLWGLRLK